MVEKEKYTRPTCVCHTVGLHGHLLQEVTSIVGEGPGTEEEVEGVKGQVTTGFDSEGFDFKWE